MIGYYVHHQGRGHLHHAQCIAAHVPGPSTILSSLPRPNAWHRPWVALPPDDTVDPVDATAQGRLHWVPLHHDGHRERMGILARWIAQTRPAVFVSDVSVEVAVLVRLLGIPVVVAAMRGDRQDEAHRLGYDLANVLLAPWPGSLPEPGWPAHWHAKAVHTGSISRYDGRPRPMTRCGGNRPGADNEVVVMLGAGGADITPEQLREAAEATPDWSWTVLGGPGTHWVEDPWPLLCRASVVITHAGRTPSRSAPQRACPPS
ncbi:hypothetical protein [Streptomyces sp. NPDC056670]|uniref:hypothetical protein n=1 Tax=Streptomyces sp. NPDC056670 TaxID=3345904 RepID=UPI0036B6B679